MNKSQRSQCRRRSRQRQSAAAGIDQLAAEVKRLRSRMSVVAVSEELCLPVSMVRRLSIHD